MQRVSNTFLTLALTVFVLVVSLALLLAAWLMATHLVNGHLRSLLPKGLLIGLLAMGIGRATAQTAVPGTFVVVEERTRQSDGQITVSYAIVTVADTLFPPVQTNTRFPKRVITPKPAWPDEDSPLAELPDEEAVFGPTSIIGAYPGIATHQSAFRFRRKP